ncbi:MAG: DUF58 domain-containing protein [Flavobacteriales bacterium]|nr:DUF58 domain-containing protein [Flavobacteriales bacterium]MCB9197374.1 DUF58 domain-containing protein [Flavobacteriales bacterium]
MKEEIKHKEARQFGSLELLAKQAVEGFITGLHKSPFHGFSVEFAEHRLYNPGESTRHIDWKLYGRTEKLFIKRYEEETNLRCQIVIDTSSSMLFPVGEEQNKLSFSIDSAAALIYLMRKQRDAVGISLFDEQLKLHTPCKSSFSHHRFLFSELEKYLKNYDTNNPVKTNVTEALHLVAQRTHRRSLVVIFSDMLDKVEDSDAVFSALQHLKHNKHEVVLFHVTDQQKEVNFEFHNRPYTFVDMETGEEIKLNPHQLQDKIKEIAQKRQKALQLKCGMYRIDYVPADINLGFDQVLLQYLIKRQKMI